MLGDAGANALVAVLGVAAATTLSRPARLALLAAITGLTAASEKVSFTAVIARTPVLHKLDMLGRRPPAPAPPAGAPGTGPDDDTGPLPAQPGPHSSPGAVATEPDSSQAGVAEAASGTHPAAP